MCTSTVHRFRDGNPATATRASGPATNVERMSGALGPGFRVSRKESDNRDAATRSMCGMRKAQSAVRNAQCAEVPGRRESHPHLDVVFPYVRPSSGNGM